MASLNATLHTTQHQLTQIPMSNEHVHPIMADTLNAFYPTAMADRYNEATINKNVHAMDQLYRSITMLKIYYDYHGLASKGFDPAVLSKNADAVQELLVTIAHVAERLDEDNQIRLAWERCVSKTIDVYDAEADQ